ncbi:hypothetical protein D1Y85_19405 [Paraburkholderia dinghuensis]|uniref:Uncharacterized protein n=1 Tax=Paraburkholderia dinghuensis TaxID=2305225 RepID=A0A3N6MKE2_9BURK|nr:hypothetical protein D1Y85_19405 [Paraburkholderia dinghuensis]
MNANSLNDDFPPLAIDRIRDLAVAVREDFGTNLSRTSFTGKRLDLLEDIPGYVRSDGIRGGQRVEQRSDSDRTAA